MLPGAAGGLVAAGGALSGGCSGVRTDNNKISWMRKIVIGCDFWIHEQFEKVGWTI